MVDIVARLRVGKLGFETMVDLDSAMKLKKGIEVSITEVIRDNFIYTDLKKGMKAGKAELELSFGTTELADIVERIVKKGDLEVTQEFRDEALENRKKQVIDFLSKNAVDARTNRPFTPEMIASAIKQAGVKIENVSVDKQIKNIIETLKKAIPIKIETKKIKIKIPAQFTGQTYGLVQEYKEKEDWLSDGSLEIILNIPVGITMDFYDRLNKITHGSALTSEIKD
ncbi:MAG: ribosome assembly factor SBDS [Candidatus Pacearchaeota archaeon]|jgi:ribosome maturation protein SDO1